jgi:glycosyltransferase involved in cell wall biosynthesis
VDRQASRLATWRSNLPEEAKVLLYLGRLHLKKGLANLLQAWSEVRRAGGEAAQNWYLVIAGWDQDGHQASLEAITLQRNIGDTVHFIGPQFGLDKDAAFRSSDAFVLPSLSEGMPLAVLEAWAHGLPVLMTPHCNLPEGFARGAARSPCRTIAAGNSERGGWNFPPPSLTGAASHPSPHRSTAGFAASDLSPIGSSLPESRVVLRDSIPFLKLSHES